MKTVYVTLFVNESKHKQGIMTVLDARRMYEEALVRSKAVQNDAVAPLIADKHFAEIENGKTRSLRVSNKKMVLSKFD